MNYIESLSLEANIMICIDSQIWIYYFDKKAAEHDACTKWIEPILLQESLLFCGIIPMEIAHTLYNIPHRRKDMEMVEVIDIMDSFMGLANSQFVEIDQSLVLDALKILQEKRASGIGGRDSLILAAMSQFNVMTIITHDKNILELEALNRIDPSFDPPLKWDMGEKFDQETWNKALKQIGRK